MWEREIRGSEGREGDEAAAEIEKRREDGRGAAEKKERGRGREEENL